MYVDLSFDEWLPRAKAAYAQAGLTEPDEPELWELLHMELREAEKSIEMHVEEELANK